MGNGAGGLAIVESGVRLSDLAHLPEIRRKGETDYRVKRLGVSGAGISLRGGPQKFLTARFPGEGRYLVREVFWEGLRFKFRRPLKVEVSLKRSRKHRGWRSWWLREEDGLLGGCQVVSRRGDHLVWEFGKQVAAVTGRMIGPASYREDGKRRRGMEPWLGALLSVDTSWREIGSKRTAVEIEGKTSEG